MEFSFLFPPSLLPLFFKVGPIGRGREFSKDETTGVMKRGREKRGGKERNGAHFHTGLLSQEEERVNQEGHFPPVAVG